MRQLFYVQLQANHEEQKNQAKFAPGSGPEFWVANLAGYW